MRTALTSAIALVAACGDAFAHASAAAHSHDDQSVLSLAAVVGAAVTLCVSTLRKQAAREKRRARRDPR